jgi:aminopeptidase N
MRRLALATAWFALSPSLVAQVTRPTARPDSSRHQATEHVPKRSRADTLRGSFTTPGRKWWDVTFYDLHVAIQPNDRSITGYNGITYKVLEPAKEMQIDLMEPLVVDSMTQDGRKVSYRREGAAFFATLTAPQRTGDRKTITVYYRGRPQIAKNPPWQGGFSWTADSLGRPWIVTTDQGMGASVWWPNKDTQADEPDSQRIALTVPAPLIDVSNGRLRSTKKNPNGTTTYEWFVVNPINNYAIAVAAGNYAHYSETFDGLKGALTMDFWPIDYNLENAKRQFPQARSMLKCFEYWFGPYPWYEDGCRKRNASGTGLGLK